jgi:hypothetical protein
VLINEAMPGYVKVGKTEDIERRLLDLDWTNLPLPFECFYAAKVANAGFVEAQLHDAFGVQRVRARREFFRVSPERVVAALRLAELENVTPSPVKISLSLTLGGLMMLATLRASVSLSTAIWRAR